MTPHETRDEIQFIDRGDFWTIRAGGKERTVEVTSVTPDRRGRLACRGVKTRRLSYVHPRDPRIVRREKGIPW